ncbi:MAG: esterase YqiA [Marinobacter sp.]|nr:esterase YqiA [Marinobacter sp.]
MNSIQTVPVTEPSPVPGVDDRPVLLYLHGFNSSPKSQKANELRSWLATGNWPLDLQVPQLGFDPQQALAVAASAIAAAGPRIKGIVGSSLGGYYAAVLSHRFGLPAALVNPAVYPYRLLRDYLGPQHNPYSGEHYTLTEAHVAALEAMDPGEPDDPGRLLLLLQTGDETLDYRQALARYPASPAWIQAGGDHRFQHFERVLPAIMAFLGFSSR